MMAKRIQPREFDTREKRIWDTAYATAFVRLFVEVQEAYNFDHAASVALAEWPRAIADLAVLRLREWRADEEPRVGRQSQHPEWE